MQWFQFLLKYDVFEAVFQGSRFFSGHLLKSSTLHDFVLDDSVPQCIQVYLHRKIF